MMLVRPRLCALILALAACGDGGGFPDAKLPDGAPLGGTLTVQWSLTDAMGMPITCAQVGAQAVTLVLRNRAVSGASTEVFTCSSGQGTTPPIAPGIYDVQFELAHGTFGLIAQATTQTSITIESAQNTMLAPVVYAVDATGALDLKISANKTGGNCGATGNMGAGITNMTITLQRTPGATCEPVTFTISGMPARMYTVNCDNPVVTPCIEADQSLTVMGVPTGKYAIHVRGRVGGTECYFNDESLTVPPAGNTLTRTLNLGYRMGMGCP